MSKIASSYTKSDFLISAESSLAGFRDKFDKKLSSFIDDKIVDAHKYSDFCENMIKNIKSLILRGGKRLRPALVYYGYRGLKSDREDELIFASMSIELLHCYLLIHDDIMDNDSKRRGGPTLHELYRSYPSSKYFRSDRDYGISMATVAGDIVCGYAFEVLSQSNFPIDNVNRAINELAHMSVIAGYGQALDIDEVCSSNDKEINAFKINQLKTTEYTIRGPLVLGAVLAGIDNVYMNIFDNYASSLGQAFQIQDDILGLFGSEEQIGKQNASDIREGKRTILITTALKMANISQKRIINNFFGKPDLKESEIKSIRKVIIDTGALEHCKSLCRSLVEDAKSAIPKQISNESKNFLESLADYIVSRSK